MAQIDEIIERLFEGTVTEEQILEAFRIDHPGFKAHPMASAHEDGVRVRGDFHTSTADCRRAGEFDRVLFRAGSSLAAHHLLLFVEEPFREQDLATCHLAKLVRFYCAVGIEYIYLEAAGDGVIVWPQMGFELQEASDKKLLHEYFRSVVDDLGYEAEPPERTPALALFPEIEGVKVGLKSLKLTYKALECKPIPMIMDLQDASTRAFLEGRGIL